jgi:hypothetical protein
MVYRKDIKEQTPASNENSVTVAVNKGILASILFLPSCPEGVN